MYEMDILTYTQGLLGVPDKDTAIAWLIEKARQEFLVFTGRIEVPSSAECVIINMVIEAFNRLGAEGLTSQSFSNISENFTDGYSANILTQLKRFRKLKTL